MSNSNLLEGKVAIVSGCSRGIGRAIMNTFALNGAVVYAIDLIEGSLDDVVSDYILPISYQPPLDKVGDSNPQTQMVEFLQMA